MFWPDQSQHVRPRQMGHCLLYFWMKVAGRHCLCQTFEQSWRTWFDTSWGPKPWLKQCSCSTWLFDWDVHGLMWKPQLSPNALNILTSWVCGSIGYNHSHQHKPLQKNPPTWFPKARKFVMAMRGYLASCRIRSWMKLSINHWWSTLQHLMIPMI